MANFIEFSSLLLLANSFLQILFTTNFIPLLKTCSCQNIRVQVNNDKLQSAPYLIEAIRQIESQQQQQQNATSGNYNDELHANYSTIISHNPSTNQIINHGSISGSSFNRDRRQPEVGQASPSSSSSSSRLGEITESEPSNSRLANLLGQPELLLAENLPQASRKRNNAAGSSSSSNNQQNANNNNNKPPVRAVPVTSSHLKRPFGLTFELDNQAVSMGGAVSGDDQQLPPSSVSISNSQVITDNRRFEMTPHNHQLGGSLVSPSVVSDESLASHTVVKMQDVSEEADISKMRLTASAPYHELEQAISSSSGYVIDTKSQLVNSSSTYANSMNSPRFLYPKAPNRSYNHNHHNLHSGQPRPRVTVGAGNQLSTSSSSTLGLESHRSTDLSPTNYNVVHHSSNNNDLLLENMQDVGSSSNLIIGGVDQSGSSSPNDDSNESNPIANETSDSLLSGDGLISASNDLTSGGGLSIASNQSRDLITPHQAASISNQQLELQAAMQRESSLQIDSSYKYMNHSNYHNQNTRGQQPNQSQVDQPMRVIEIPEKIVVSAGDLHKNDDPIEIMPSPPALPPIRLVLNRTRLGKPDARCPKEGVSTFEHPSACDKYYYCDDGNLIEQTCPNGLMYGTMYRVKDYCVYRWHADCVDKTIPNPISSPGCRWQYGVFSVQGSPKCTPDYYECIAGRFEVKKCSITGQIYDDRTKACQYAEKVGCPEEIISDFQCPTDDRSNSFWPFPRYYLDTKTIIHCVNDKPKIMRCPDNERVDLEHLYCIPMDAKEPVVMDRKVRERQKGTMQPQKNVS